MEKMALYSRASIFLLLSIFTLYVVYGNERGGMDPINQRERWQDVAAAKRKETVEKIPEDWRLPEAVLIDGRKEKKIAGDFIEGLLDPRTREITGFDGGAILELISNGSLTTIEVTKAFCKRAAYAHQLVWVFLTRLQWIRVDIPYLEP